MQDEPSSDGVEPKVTGDLEAVDRAKKLVGTVVSDRYRLHNLLAMGGMGAVFTAEHVHMRKRVAVKLLHPDMQGLPGLVARFEREAIVGAHVEHSNVASARDFGKLSDGSYYLVLEFVRGLTLRQLINQGPISPRRSVRIATQIAAGLGAVHARGIVHRDVAPRNIMVLPGQEDRVKIIDFGFAKVPVEKFAAMSVPQGTPVIPSEITAPGVIFGTIGYLAPEAALGMKAVTASSDLYALGAILYELLAGVPPFEAETQAGLFLMHRSEPIPPIRERAPQVDVPPELEAIAVRLMSKRPEERYASAKEVVTALEAALASLEPDSRSVPPSHRDQGLQLTVIGVEAPAPLPRFEDVAEVTFDVPEEDDTSDQKVASVRPLSSARVPKQGKEEPKRWQLPVLFAVLAAIGGGAFAAHRYGLLGGQPGAANTAQPTSTATVAPTTASTTVASAPASAGDTSVPTPAPTVSAIAGLDATAWKKAVRQAPSTNNFERALEGLLALSELDPKGLVDADLQGIALETAVRFGNDKEKSTKLLDALATKFGSDGIDVLYEIWSKRGGSRSAIVAGELLAKPDVRARGTNALRIAVELREAACPDKPKLLERVRKEGDARALALLIAARAPECDASSGECCMRENPEVENTVREMVKKTEPPK